MAQVVPGKQRHEVEPGEDLGHGQAPDNAERIGPLGFFGHSPNVDEIIDLDGRKGDGAQKGHLEAMGLRLDSRHIFFYTAMPNENGHVDGKRHG